jgi:hypothetical protein
MQPRYVVLLGGAQVGAFDVVVPLRREGIHGSVCAFCLLCKAFLFGLHAQRRSQIEDVVVHGALELM